MLVYLTWQLDKAQRLLRQWMGSTSSTRSEQLSPEQLLMFLPEAGVKDAPAKRDND